MKRILLILAVVSAFAGAPFDCSAQDNANRLFPYPEPPKDMANLYERCNYLVYKFWDQCDLKSALSSKAKLNKAFGDWLGFMPYASADTVHLAIDNFQKSFKKDGKLALEVARMAEAWLYSDTASYLSDELYGRFVDAAVANKKIPAAERSRYEAQKLIIDNSSIGSQVPDLKLTTAAGTITSFYADSADNTLLLVYPPDCLDCTFAKTHLSADLVLNQLNDQGVVRVVTVYAGEPDAAFLSTVATYPANWINVASPEAELYFDMRFKPSIYYLDKDHKIIGKHLQVDNILEVFRSLIK